MHVQAECVGKWGGNRGTIAGQSPATAGTKVPVLRCTERRTPACLSGCKWSEKKLRRVLRPRASNLAFVCMVPRGAVKMSFAFAPSFSTFARTLIATARRSSAMQSLCVAGDA